jgi:hypothetical protein
VAFYKDLQASAEAKLEAAKAEEAKAREKADIGKSKSRFVMQELKGSKDAYEART